MIERVGRGGHDVPISDVLRRYGASMTNLAAALEMTERAWVVDNTGRGRRLLLRRDVACRLFVSETLPEGAVTHIPERFRMNT